MHSPGMNPSIKYHNSPAVADGGLRCYPAEDPYPCDIDVFPSSMQLESGQEDLRDLLQEMRDGSRPWTADGGPSFGEFEAGMMPGTTAQWGSGMQGFCAPSEAAAMAQHMTDTAGTPFHPAYMGGMPFAPPQDGNNAAAAAGQPAPMAYAPQYAVRPPPQWQTLSSFPQQQGMAGPPPGAVMYCSMPPSANHPAFAGAPMVVPPGYAYSYGFPGSGMGQMPMQMQGFAPPPGMAMQAPPQSQQVGGPAFPMACTFVFPPGVMHMQQSMAAAARQQQQPAATGLTGRAHSLHSAGATSGDEGAPTPPRKTASSSESGGQGVQVVPEVTMSRQHSVVQQQCGLSLPQVDAGRYGGTHVMMMPYGREVVLMRQAVPSITGRQASLERYREKKARRSYSKNIRYHMRKVNADRRPRVKGRFIKACEVAEAAELMNNEMPVADGDVSS